MTRLSLLVLVLVVTVVAGNPLNDDVNDRSAEGAWNKFKGAFQDMTNWFVRQLEVVKGWVVSTAKVPQFWRTFWSSIK